MVLLAPYDSFEGVNLGLRACGSVSHPSLGIHALVINPKPCSRLVLTLHEAHVELCG